MTKPQNVLPTALLTIGDEKIPLQTPTHYEFCSKQLVEVEQRLKLVGGILPNALRQRRADIEMALCEMGELRELIDRLLKFDGTLAEALADAKDNGELMEIRASDIREVEAASAGDER